MLRTAFTVVGIAGTSASILAAVKGAGVVAMFAMTLATVWVSIPLFVYPDARSLKPAANGTIPVQLPLNQL